MEQTKQAGSAEREKESREEGLAMRTAGITIVINFALSVFKAAAGILAHSGAMLSDAVHSASDVFSTVIVMIGVAVSGKKSDREHPYGHERMECVAALLLAVLLAATGLGIGVCSIRALTAGNASASAVPGIPALAAAIVSIVTKEWMYWYTRAAAKKAGSDALMADAWHHRSDALSSVGALLGIAGARMGFPFLDPAAGAVICIFILKAAVSIFRDAVNKMVDKACDEATVAQIRTLILESRGVERVDELRTRMFGAKFYVDIEIAVDAEMILKEAHEIAEEVHLTVEREFPGVKHCMVHVNPCGAETDAGNFGR